MEVHLSDVIALFDIHQKLTFASSYCDFGAEIKLAVMSVQLVYAEFSHVSTFNAENLCFLCSKNFEGF